MKNKNIDLTTKLCIIYHKKGLKHREVADLVNKKLHTKLNSENVRDRIRKLRKNYGSLESPELLEQTNAFEKDLNMSGFDTDSWSHGWLRTESSAIFIKNEKGNMSLEDIKDDIIKEMKKYAPKYPKLKRKKLPDSNLLIVDPADVHVGKLGMKEEVGEDYNIDITTKRCLEGVRGIIQKSIRYNIDKIVLVIGNDIIHIDTPYRKTTSGTPQDTDGQWWFMFKEAKKLYIKIIEELVTIADVHVIYNPSNHDYSSGFFLADSISSWFNKNKNVTFDVSIRHRKYFKYGKNLICTSHGDGAKESDMPLIMASEEKKMWSETDYRYIYLHHIHHKKQLKWQSGGDYQGATVEYLRSPSGADGWHDRNGYVQSPKAIEGFIHNKDQGQISRITHYF